MESRISSVCSGHPELHALVDRLIRTSRAGLPKMLSSGGQFAHNRKRVRGVVGLNGTSVRYSAITLLGVRRLQEADQRAALGGKNAKEFLKDLIDASEATRNLGDAALLLWGAAEIDHTQVERTFQRLVNLWERPLGFYTVEFAWALSALSLASEIVNTRALATEARMRIAAAYNRERGVFAHYVDRSRAPWHRAHVACFADQVYPIQALSLHHLAFDDPDSLAMANGCAGMICRVQGYDGQWWWHYDARNGSVLEGYPVYSVHQDAMAPMALLDLKEVGGNDHTEAVRRGLAWMGEAPEVRKSLIDRDEALIWRKVARKEPKKLVRKLRAASTRLAPGLRFGFLDRVFPPGVIDYESRPYHLGWVLYAWLTTRTTADS